MTLAARPWFETPPMVGEFVELVPLAVGHAESLFALADDDVFAHLTVARPGRPQDMRDLVDSYLARFAAGVVMPWVQVDRRTGGVAGQTAYYDVDPGHRTVAIGHTWIGRRFHRTGLNIESKLLLLSRAFDDLGAVRVVFHTDVLNERSQGAITALGARREGVLRKHRLRPDGSWRDTVQFAIVDDDWPDVRRLLLDRLASYGWDSASA